MKSFIGLAALCWAAVTSSMPHEASPYQVSVATNADSPITPSWEREDTQRLIPISPKARKGVIDPTIEEGLYALAGPRFGNALYENVTDDIATSDLKCWTKCAATVALSVPCLIGAVASKNVAKVLTCVSKSKLCGCASCFPKPIPQFLNKNVCSRSTVVDVADDERFSPYVDFSTLSTSSLSIAAFRGDIYNYQVEELRTLNKLGSSSSKLDDGDVHATCIFGDRCGSCTCCVGACIEDNCIGVC